MNRRSFLASILSAGASPWIAKAGLLMPVRELWTPWTIIDLPMEREDVLYGDWQWQWFA